MKLNLLFQFSVHIFQYDIIDVRTQMTYRCIQQFQFVLHTQFLELRTRSGVHLCTLSAVAHIDLIHIVHQINGCAFSDIFIERTAKIIGNIIFSIRKCTCSAKTTHDRTCFTIDTALYFLPVNGASSFLERIS